ncbi:MAG TPA: hypothetical protein V6D04_11970, partial [Candidatus Obscuribacterales bacterium]
MLSEVDIDKATLLGAPILPGPNVDGVLEGKRTELQLLLQRIRFMPAHDGLFLLTNIVAIPRLLYLLRTVPCTGNVELQKYDDAVRSALESLLNIELPEPAWLQASLPVRFGGLGMRSTVALAPSAFLASAARALDLMAVLLPPFFQTAGDKSVTVAVNSWELQVGPTVSQPSGVMRKVQKAWDAPCCQAKAQSLLDSALDQTTKVRLLASREETSGAWLKAFPLSSIGLKLEDNVISVVVSLRLGCGICEP